MSEENKGYISLEELGFKVKTYNALKRYGVNSLSDLHQVSAEDLKKIRNLGPAALKEVTEKLAALESKKEEAPIKEFKINLITLEGKVIFEFAQASNKNEAITRSIQDYDLDDLHVISIHVAEVIED